MGSPKDEVTALLKKLPDDASFEDIQYHLYVLEKVKRGLDRAQTEGTVSHGDAKRLLADYMLDADGIQKTVLKSLAVLNEDQFGTPRIRAVK